MADQEPRTGGVAIYTDGTGLDALRTYGDPTHIAFPLAEAEALLAEGERLRARIHEIQCNADARNAELHRKVAYYEAIADRTRVMLNRFKVERGERRVIEWFADILHTQPLDHRMPPSPGSTYAFWLAFQQVIEADMAARIDPTHIAFPLAEAETLIDPNDPAVRERIAQLAEDIDPGHPVALFDSVLAALRGKP